MLQAQANEQNVSPDVYLMICLTDAQLDDREGLVTGEVLCHSPAAEQPVLCSGSMVSVDEAQLVCHDAAAELIPSCLGVACLSTKTNRAAGCSS